MAEEQQKIETPPPPAPTAMVPRPGDDALEMGFGSGASFALLQRVATILSKSSLVPTIYQESLPNCIIALNMASRMRADPLMVMQNLYIVHNRPGWSAKFLIATINQSGGFSKLRYEWKGEPNTPEWGCRAWALEKATGERLDGPWITLKMANDEGWVNKNGSKWKTMPVKMFMYRAGAWFVDLYAPELSMGLPTREDLEDITDLELVETEPGVYGAAPREGGNGNEGGSGEPKGTGDQAADLAASLKGKRSKGTKAAPAKEEPPAEKPKTAAPSDIEKQQVKINELIEALVDRGYEGNAFEQIAKIAGVRKVKEIPEDKLEEVIAWARVELAKLEG